jgi:hypothetical protein
LASDCHFCQFQARTSLDSISFQTDYKQLKAWAERVLGRIYDQ